MNKLISQQHKQNWDAIVIGGGIGGLSTAAFLATNGQKVLLLEQYNVVGGCSHVFRRKRQWEFDVGIHYIGDCGEKGQLTTMLKSLGLKDRIQFALMDSTGYDTVITPNHRVKIPYGWDNYLNNLIQAFPNEEKGLRQFIDIISRIGMAIDRSRTPASLWGTTKFAFNAGSASIWAMMPVSKLWIIADLAHRHVPLYLYNLGSMVVFLHVPPLFFMQAYYKTILMVVLGIHWEVDRF